MQADSVDGSTVKERAAAVLAAMSIKPAPHLILRLDDRGQVIDFECSQAADRFESASVSHGSGVHQCLHPVCTEAHCGLLLSLDAAMDRVIEAKIVEWEYVDAAAHRTLRLHLRRAPENARTVATLTVTDITDGRRAASALRDLNRLLAEVIHRHKAGAVPEKTRLDRKLRTMTAELIVAQEKERQRIASELHDGVGQWLAMAKFSLESGIHRYGTEGSLDELQRALANLRSGIDEVRATVRHLRPSVLAEFGLVPTVELICHELQLSCPRMNVSCRIEGEQQQLSSPLQIAIVRILQEAAQNACKHAQASRLDVSLVFETHHVSLLVADNGQGMPGSGRKSQNSLGLVSIRERVAQTGGDLSIVSSPGEGTSVAVLWDLKVAGGDTGSYKTIGDGVAGDGGSASQV